MILSLSAQSSSQKENFVNTSEKLLKKGDLTFTVVRYSTCNLKFVSNILSMTVATLPSPDYTLKRMTNTRRIINKNYYFVPDFSYQI